MARVYVFACNGEETIVVIGRAKVVVADSVEKAREFLVNRKCRLVDLVWDSSRSVLVDFDEKLRRFIDRLRRLREETGETRIDKLVDSFYLVEKCMADKECPEDDVDCFMECLKELGLKLEQVIK